MTAAVGIMRGIVLTEAGLEFRSNLPVPTPLPGEVLVRVTRAGLCETDLQLVRGYMRYRGILGHEFVGVAQAGRWAGRRVVGEINCACDRCELCLAGLRTHCPQRSVLGILGHDGAFADFVAVPEVNLHPVDDALSDDEAVFVEPLAAAFQIPAQVAISSGQRIVVLGDGRLGNLCAQVLARICPNLTVVGKHAAKLKRLEDLGLRTVLLDQVDGLERADLVVDCTGSGTGLETALRLVRPRGTVVLKTTVAGAQTLSLAPAVIDEVTIVGSRCGPFPAAIEALERREIQVAPLIDGRYRLEDGLDAFERAATTPVLKLLFAVAESAETQRKTA